ncbi:hypothetical protein ACFLV0_03760 [Chloroflexota bacterium]
MENEPSEIGLDELIRLSQQFTRQEKEHTEREQQRAEHGKKVRGVLQGLKELNISMAIEPLKQVAAPEIIARVNELKGTQGTEDLRKLISGMGDDMEKLIGDISVKNPDAAPLVNSIRAFNILLDLYFSLQ